MNRAVRVRFEEGVDLARGVVTHALAYVLAVFSGGEAQVHLAPEPGGEEPGEQEGRLGHPDHERRAGARGEGESGETSYLFQSPGVERGDLADVRRDVAAAT